MKGIGCEANMETCYEHGHIMRFSGPVPMVGVPGIWLFDFAAFYIQLICQLDYMNKKIRASVVICWHAFAVKLNKASGNILMSWIYQEYHEIFRH